MFTQHFSFSPVSTYVSTVELNRNITHVFYFLNRNTCKSVVNLKICGKTSQNASVSTALLILPHCRLCFFNYKETQGNVFQPLISSYWCSELLSLTGLFPNSDEGDEIVECDNCGITVHEGMYLMSAWHEVFMLLQLPVMLFISDPCEQAVFAMNVDLKMLLSLV